MDHYWEKIEQHFLEALSLEGAEREAFLENTYRKEPELSKELKNLLLNVNEASLFFQEMESGVKSSLDKALSGEELIGTVIGPYQLTGMIGQGGMATIYKAARSDGKFQHEVVFKVMSEVISSDYARKIFQQEQQILAKLNHPNIARLYNGGILDNGTPYIVMELVEGKPLDVYCREKKLSLQGRLQLFTQICEALQYAHQQLILHQDIKPQNVLVTSQGVVKLLDFGIGKSLNEKEVIKHNTFIGTPAFASPEQLLRQNVSTASDIYQLGILLHLLVSEELPFDDQLKPAQLISQILTQSPEGPSRKKETILIPAELDSIISKAMQRKPEDRYPSVEALIQDIENYKNNYPVRAHSRGNFYLGKKLVQRNKLSSLLSLLVLLTLVSGIFFTSRQARIALQNEQKANLQRQRAEQISTFLVDFFKSPDPRQVSGEGKDVTVKEFFKNGLQQSEERLGSQPGLQLEIQSIISDVYFNLNYHAESIALEEALLPKYKQAYGEDAERYWDSRLRVARGYYETGKVEEADSIYAQVMKRMEQQQQQESLAFAKVLNEYGLFLHTVKGNYNASDSVLQLAETLYLAKNDTLSKDFADLVGSIGTLRNQMGDFALAGNYYERSLAIKKQVTKDPVDIALTESNLSTILQQLGELESAREMQLNSLSVLEDRLGEKHIHTMHAYNNMSFIYNRLYDFEKAEELANKCLNLYLEKYGESSYETGYVYLNTIIYLLKKGELDEADSRIASSKSIFARTLPADHFYHFLPLIYKSSVYIERKMPQQALKLALTAKDILDGALPPTHSFQAITESKIGTAYLMLGDYPLAEEYLTNSYQNLLTGRGSTDYNTQETIRQLIKLYSQTKEEEKLNVFKEKQDQAYLNL